MCLRVTGAGLVCEPGHMLSICACGLAAGRLRARCYVNALVGRGGETCRFVFLSCHLSIPLPPSRSSASWRWNSGQLGRKSWTSAAPQNITRPCETLKTQSKYHLGSKVSKSQIFLAWQNQNAELKPNPELSTLTNGGDKERWKSGMTWLCRPPITSWCRARTSLPLTFL